MAHISENAKPLQGKIINIDPQNLSLKQVDELTDVCLIWLPCFNDELLNNTPLQKIPHIIPQITEKLGGKATLIIVGEIIDLIQVQEQISSSLHFHHWIAIRRRRQEKLLTHNQHLPNSHFGALIYTKYQGSLQHTKTRIRYTYCPACDKTTKDYGGKKHTYHEDGTLLSDVWRDEDCDPNIDLTPIITRFADLFGIDSYQQLTVFDCRKRLPERRISTPPIELFLPENQLTEEYTNKILTGDCLDYLKKLPDNSIDFAFVDPPYNLKKQYSGYSDDLEIEQYFQWCDQWIREIARVLKPGRTCAILNIPLRAIRHFIFSKTLLQFQNWIVWDALAFPVRLIMPAHYTILCFSKGKPRELPGLMGESGITTTTSAPETFNALNPLADDFCLRSSCIKKRKNLNINDRTLLTDLWSDIHRLKHNSRRVDHPCQLPPHLMYRLISLFTEMGEVVLDCFNGAGTTTLAAHQIGRKYIGIEISPEYSKIAIDRHDEIVKGLDPFRKEDRILRAKNSPVPRLIKQKYQVSKKTLQLEVKRIAHELGYLPSREEVIQYGQFPIKYYDEYFSSWGEVCAAARTTGMKETRNLTTFK
ncbi:DNA methyltransferase [Gloeothece verrucosa]|uniref:DNA methylase N-4/N-6 domain protein n=1 Tax=Gloeothece verrucosa (strain PCC 7822) TaxID=497965 RepID=E0UGP9_GLOV7|nr:DNA methyltransferase [Gloeothece verrucosa]ADN13258.1 DNA methylase N-4/N-6 domain protein [Gloeothece verrucosa PCC 7822]